MGRQRCASVLLGCDAARVLYLEVVHHPKCKALALMELEFVCVCDVNALNMSMPWTPLCLTLQMWTPFLC